MCSHVKVTISIGALSEQSSGENCNFLNMYTGSIHTHPSASSVMSISIWVGFQTVRREALA